jgi:hypothetical protein
MIQANHTRVLIKKLLELAVSADMDSHGWEVQGLGMLRLRITKEVRLHVWHNGLVYSNSPSVIHNHPWDFESTIVVGSLRNVRYNEVKGLEPNHHVGMIVCGPGGGIVPRTIEPAHLEISQVDEYKAGDRYVQHSNEFHNTVFQNGTVTIIERHFKEDTEHARVGFKLDGTWESAEPRKATEEEIQLGCRAALALF